MKAKTTKKALALLLAILMLFLIFPIGVISVGADTVTYDYTITDMASWNEVANNNTTYKSAKIKIDADITLTEDFVFPLFTDFAGTLDGAKSATENYTLSGAENFTINSAIDNRGVIAGEISGDASITNLNFKDLSLNSDNKCHAIVAGQVNANGKTISIQNISIDSCSITTKSTKYYAGAIFGNIAKGSVELDDINIKDTTVNGGLQAAFVTGGHHGTSLNINNLTVTGGSVIASSNTIGSGTGGSAVVGKIGNGPSLVVTNSSVTGMTLQGDGASGKGVCLGFYVGYSIGTTTGSNVTIDGCSVENCTISNANSPSGGIAGELGGADGKKLVLKNLNVNVTITNNSDALYNKEKNLAIGTGGIIGTYSPCVSKTTSLTIENVNVLGSLEAKGNVGAIIGVSSTLTNTVDEVTAEDFVAKHVTDTTLLKNCHSTMNISGALANANAGMGALIGTWGMVDTTFNAGGVEYNGKPMFSNNGTLTIQGCVVEGGLKNTSTSNRFMGGVIGYYGYFNCTVNVENCLIAATFEGNSGDTIGIVVGRSFRSESHLNVSDCLTTSTIEAENAFPIVGNGKTYGKTSFYLYVNGELGGKGITNTGLVTVTLPDINAEDYDNKALYGLNNDGYISYVRGHVTSGYWQAPLSAKEAGETYSIRIIAVTMIDITDSNFGIKIVVKDTAGDIIHDYSQDNLTFELYDGLNEYSEEEGLDRVSASEDFGGKKFIAAVINGIPAGEAYNIEVTPYVGATEYVTHTIMIGANGQPA